MVGRILTPIFLVSFFVGYAFGQSYMMHHHMMHKHKKLLSIHKLKKLYMRALHMVEDKNVKKKLKDDVVKMVEELGKKKAEVKASKMRLKILLKDPGSTDKDVEKAFEEFLKKKQEYMKKAFQWLLKLRNTVGPDVFSKLFQKRMMMQMMEGKGMMMQKKMMMEGK